MTDRSDPFRILFVCTGNTCRSPLAEALARRAVEARGWEGVEVASAGVSATAGSPASAGSLRAAVMSGLDLARHRSRPLDAATVAEADLILTMSAGHAARVAELGGEGRVDLLARFAGSGAVDVPDPFGGDDGDYVRALEAIDELVARSIERLAPTLDP